LLPTWLDRVYHASVDLLIGTTPNFRYASGWWTIPDKRAYMAVGFLRQLIIVLPDVDTVAVVTGRKHYPPVPLIDRIAGAAKSESVLPADAAGSTRLAGVVKDAAIEKPSEVSPASPLAKTIYGKAYRFGTNAFGLRGVSAGADEGVGARRTVAGAHDHHSGDPHVSTRQDLDGASGRDAHSIRASIDVAHL